VLRERLAMALPYRDSNYYRERAEECRTVGDILGTPELREQMYRTAADYERMAVDADKVREDLDAAQLRNVR
jgi:hypothetical protein